MKRTLFLVPFLLFSSQSIAYTANFIVKKQGPSLVTVSSLITSPASEWELYDVSYAYASIVEEGNETDTDVCNIERVGMNSMNCFAKAVDSSPSNGCEYCSGYGTEVKLGLGSYWLEEILDGPNNCIIFIRGQVDP